MQSTDVLIGLDVGTQSTKAVLYHPGTQTIKTRASSLYDLDESEGSENGRAEQHPHKWLRALHICLNKLGVVIKKEGYTVAGVGVSGQQHGMVPLDKNFQVVRSAKLWCDVEASVQAKKFSEKATEVMKEFLGQDCPWSIPAGFTAPKVLWMKETEPELFERVKWIILPHDYVNLCLKTGLGYDLKSDDYQNDKNIQDYKPCHAHIDTASIIPSTDAGDASGSGLLHPHKPQYVSELAQIIHEGYEDYLPKILPPNEVSGHLSKYWKEATGIDPDDSRSIPISIGSGDNMMTALGCKCAKPGNAVLSLGTR